MGFGYCCLLVVHRFGTLFGGRRIHYCFKVSVVDTTLVTVSVHGVCPAVRRAVHRTYFRMTDVVAAANFTAASFSA